MADTESNADLISMTADIVAAYVSKNSVETADIATLIASVHSSLASAGAPAEPEAPAKPVGAVSAKKSLANPEHIISMIDGKPYKTLKRHLTNNGHTPASYRAAFGLPASYPIVSEGYSKFRRELSLAAGLGRKAGTKVKEALEGAVEAVTPKKRGRPAGAKGIKAAKEAAAKQLSGSSEASDTNDASETQTEA